MASINLKHTSGNGTILNSPAANPSSDITLKLPSTTGSAGQVLKVASANHSSTNAELEFAAAAASGLFTSYALLQNQHSATSANLGAFTSGDWRTRDINTEVADPDSIVTLASNQFTLQAGSYLIRFSQTGYAVNRLAVRLRNITDGSTAGFGEAAYYNAGQGNMWSTSGIARVVISGAKVFEVQGQVETTKSSNGFGFTMITGACTNTSVEIYKES